MSGAVSPGGHPLICSRKIVAFGNSFALRGSFAKAAKLQTSIFAA